MVKYIFVAVVALVAFQACLAAPKKAAPEKAAEDKDVVERLSNQAQTLVNEVTTTLGIQVPTSDEIVNTLNNSTKKLADSVNEMITKMKTEIKAHSPQVNEIINNAQAKLKETEASLKTSVGPDATARAQELQDNIKTGLNTIFAEMDKLVKAIEPQVKGAQDDLTKFTKSQLDQFVKVTKEIETNVKTSIADHEKTHPKKA